MDHSMCCLQLVPAYCSDVGLIKMQGGMGPKLLLHFGY